MRENKPIKMQQNLLLNIPDCESSDISQSQMTIASKQKQNYHEKLIKHRSKVIVKQIELNTEVIDNQFYVYKIGGMGSKNQGEMFAISKNKILRRKILVNVNPLQLGNRMVFMFNKEL